MSFSLYNFPVCLVLTIISLICFSTGLKLFGQTCSLNATNEVDLCDGDLGLNCTEANICECSKLRDSEDRNNISTVWSQGFCLVKIKETCSFKKDGVFVEYGCIQHGQCKNNTCSCKRGFKQNTLGTLCKSGSSSAAAIASGKFQAVVGIFPFVFGIYVCSSWNWILSAKFGQ